ncbi:MAG: hydrolase, partial [Peptoniphilaceae bacterium]|nr:hydrolase [Peptoniphilaceae bacterium]
LYALKAAKKEGIKTVGIKDFPYNKREWDDIQKEADIVLDKASDIDIKSI